MPSFFIIREREIRILSFYTNIQWWKKNKIFLASNNIDESPQLDWSENLKKTHEMGC